MDVLPKVTAWVSQLNADPAGSSNNVVRLLEVLQPSHSEAAVRAAVQGLKLFFVQASHAGDLASTGEDVPAAPAGVRPSGLEDAQRVYRQWVRRQYGTFWVRLLQLLQSDAATASTQVSAAAALMECVRSEGGPGTFANGLYARLLSTMVTSQAVKPEVYTLLCTRYLHCADVRYYTLASVKALAARHAAATPAAGQRVALPATATAPAPRAGPGAGNGTAGAPVGEGAPSAKDSAEVDAEAAALAAAAAGPNVGDVQLADLVRNLFDVLDNLPEFPAGQGDASALTSWCGAAEAGVVSGAADKNESARARRKRKAHETAGGQPQGTASVAAAAQRAAWVNAKNQKRLFGDAWLSFLSLPIPADIYRKVLLRLHSKIIPHMMQPVLLADFLTHSLNQGGLVGVLALNGIFVLLTQHGLEYPAFFTRLYQLLTPDVFVSSHRPHFFKLADMFLSSGLVPAYTAAAFAKKFARLALTAPPAGALLCLAFIHNLIRRHPSCMVLLHNPAAHKASAGAAGGQSADALSDEEMEGDGSHSRGEALPAAASTQGDSSGKKRRQDQQELRHSKAAKAANGSSANGSAKQGGGAASASGELARLRGEDVYDFDEPDPAQSRAVESSLWEVAALRNHYCPQVAALSGILDKDLGDRTKTAEVSVNELLATSYASLFGQELERRLKKVATAFYQEVPRHLFDLNAQEDWAGWDLALPQGAGPAAAVAGGG